jgi:NADPH2:quinone reductase
MVLKLHASDRGTTMKARAMVIHRFGGPEEFKLEEVDIPDPASGQLLVGVVASGTNPVEAKLRADGSWAGLTPPVVLGYEVSGVVAKIGPCVTDFLPGDEVYYTPEIRDNPYGSYCELNLVSAAIVAHKPKNLDHYAAAAVPLAGGTAWEGIMRRLKVRLGETILIHGGAGGVGSFAVQFAKVAGARVIASASTANQQALVDLGVDNPVDYQKEDATEAAVRITAGKGVDVVFDTVGKDLVGRSLHAIRPFGRIACILPPGGDLSSLSGRNLTLHGIMLTRERQRLEELRIVLEQGKVRPLIEAVLPLEEVAKAHQRLEAGHGRGKIVLRVAKT